MFKSLDSLLHVDFANSFKFSADKVQLFLDEVNVLLAEIGSVRENDFGFVRLK